MIFHRSIVVLYIYFLVSIAGNHLLSHSNRSEESCLIGILRYTQSPINYYSHMQLALFSAAILGHIFLWIGILNRLHSTATPRRLMEVLTLTCFLIMGLVPVIAGLWWFAGGQNIPAQIDWKTIVQPGWLALYSLSHFLLVGCFCHTGSVGCDYQCLRRPPDLLRFHRQRRMTISPAVSALTAEEHSHHFAVHLPGNETLQLDLTEREFEVPGLPKILDGLAIVHMSDLHFTGMVGKAYFREVVRISNELKPDWLP